MLFKVLKWRDYSPKGGNFKKPNNRIGYSKPTDSEDYSFSDDNANGVIKGKVSFHGSIPNKESVSEASSTYQYKAFRDLQNVGSIDVKADPYQTALRGDYPYAIISKTNKVLDSNYSGVVNIDGNTVVRLFNSDRTQFINKFDVGTMNMRFNYLYAAYSVDDDNLAVNQEFGKVIAEALAKGYSTMLTQLPFYSDAVESSDFPDVSNMNTTTGKPNVLAKGSGVQNKLCLLLHYQSVLQSIVSPLAKYVLTMSLEQAIMNMSYRREAPLMTALYGQLKKKAFVATLNSIGTSIIADYFDTSWYKQINTVTGLCSRRSNAMDDPILTLSATHKICNCKIYAAEGTGWATTPYYDSDNLKASGIWINPDNFLLEGTSKAPVTITLEDAIYRLNRMLDISTMLTWARQLNTNSLPSGTTITTPSAYYECINTLISRIQVMISRFTSAMTEVRTFLDRMSQSNMIYWVKGQWINVSDVKQLDPDYNMILGDIFQVYMSGSSKIEWDSQTQRWRVNTLWNKYTGISNFDRLSGGSFLTCSLRSIEAPESYSKLDSLYLIPKLFTTELKSGYQSCLFTSRGGIRVGVERRDITIMDNDMLCRLDPLSTSLIARVPDMRVPSGLSTSVQRAVASSMLQMLTTVAGYGSVYNSDGTSSLCSALDPDYVGFIDVELEDVSNQMITFVRNYAPFRVSTPDGNRKIGFGSAAAPSDMTTK